jgi:hypothetical protein
MNMSLNTQENIFWLLAKKYSMIQIQSTDNSAKLNEGEAPFKVIGCLNTFQLIIEHTHISLNIAYIVLR